MAAVSPVLDHVVIDVRDRIDEAAECFRSLGFQLTPRGHHTLGSVNHLAMFATDYLELLGFAERGAIRPEIVRFPVGLNGLVFETGDADVVYAPRGGGRSPGPAGAVLLPPRRARRRYARCASFAPPASTRPRWRWAGSIFASIRPPTWLAAGVADPSERRLRDFSRGGRD